MPFPNIFAMSSWSSISSTVKFGKYALRALYAYMVVVASALLQSEFVAVFIVRLNRFLICWIIVFVSELLTFLIAGEKRFFAFHC